MVNLQRKTSAGDLRCNRNKRNCSLHHRLKTYHTFSFADYMDPKFVQFGPLRVINEDRVRPGSGFPFHPHTRYEIFSYIMNGSLLHQDSMGNKEIIERGGVQFTSASTGIRHSEYNADFKDKDVHFLQIWCMPRIQVPKPGYQTGNFPDSVKKNRLALLIAPDNFDSSRAPAGQELPVKIHADVFMKASLLDPGASVEHVSDAEQGGPRKVYLHNPMTGKTELKVEHVDSGTGLSLKQGDGAFVEGFEGKLKITNVGAERAEFVLFDME